MDLGATVCTSRRPTCLLCPVRAACRAAGAFEAEAAPATVAVGRAAYRPKTERFEGSSRYFRGRVVAHLRGLVEGESCGLGELGDAVRSGYSDDDAPWLLGLLEGLARDGLVAVHGGGGLDAGQPAVATHRASPVAGGHGCVYHSDTWQVGRVDPRR